MADMDANWKRVVDDEGIYRLEEGQMYLFAQEMANGGCEFFVNRLVWDSETAPYWGEDDPGFEPDITMWFTDLPPGPGE